MLIAGDLAVPDQTTSMELEKVFQENMRIFSGKTLLFNFEGAIISGASPVDNKPFLYNHQSVVDILTKYTRPVFCLANNHITDLPHCFDNTIEEIRLRNIPFAGGGRSKKDSADEVIINDSGQRVAIFNACWDFLLYKSPNPNKGVYVNVLCGNDLIERVKKLKSAEPGIKIIVFVHWNLDFEKLPFPSYRRLAADLIGNGADIVAGSHSHCVQGGEKIGNGYVFYGLGNFFLPHNKYINGRLTYPAISSRELIVDWDPKTNKVICHWFNYTTGGENHFLNLEVSEEFEKSNVLKSETPYDGMGHTEYMAFFRNNRRKKLLIPVFEKYENNTGNLIRGKLLILRARFAFTLARLGIINW